MHVCVCWGGIKMASNHLWQLCRTQLYLGTLGCRPHVLPFDAQSSRLASFYSPFLHHHLWIQSLTSLQNLTSVPYVLSFLALNFEVSVKTLILRHFPLFFFPDEHRWRKSGRRAAVKCVSLDIKLHKQHYGRDSEGSGHWRYRVI